MPTSRAEEHFKCAPNCLVPKIFVALTLVVAGGQAPPVRAATCEGCGAVLPHDVQGRTLEEVLLHLNKTGSFAQRTQLSLPQHGLSGRIPPWLAAEAPRLEVLDLSGNALTGEIPAELGGLSKLQHLDLARNALSGSLPPQLGNLTELIRLSLSGNHFGEPIPPELVGLGRLQTLDLSENRLTGAVPPWLGNLTRLTRLWLPGNLLAGPIPPELGRLSELRELGLHRNHLSGPLPPQLGSLGELVGLYLFSNYLSGRIPPEFGSLRKLRHFQLYRNKLSALTPELGNLTELTILWVYENSLSGGIPPELGRLGKLQRLGLHRNRLTGTVPPELGGLAQLTLLNLGKNFLTGEIPPELARLSKLQYLLLGRNRLSGTLPPQLGSLTELRFLYAWGNSLRGEIPPELAGLGKLQHLSLSSNRLSGFVPRWLGHLTELAKLSLYNNSLSGAIPAELGGLRKLARLSLGDNQLSGPMPAELGSLTELTFLSLGGNSLSGGIPPEFAGLNKLQTLHLSGNRLSGPIPSELGNLTQLVRLYVSANRLSGRMPPRLFAGLARLEGIQVSGNPDLSGDFPTTEPAPELRQIHAAGCGFTGGLALGPAVTEVDFTANSFRALPSAWHAHSKLKSLKLAGNRMSEWPRRGVLPRSSFPFGPESPVVLCGFQTQKPPYQPPFDWPALKTLEVSGNPLGAATDARDFLFSLSTLPRLQVLRARGCGLQGEPQAVGGRMQWLDGRLGKQCSPSNNLQQGFPSLQVWDMAENLLQAVRASPPPMLLRANLSFNALGSWSGAPGAAALRKDWWRSGARSSLQQLDVRGNPALRAAILPPTSSSCVRAATHLAADPAGFKPIVAESSSGVGHVECTKPCIVGLHLLADSFRLNASALCRCMAGTAGANFACGPCPVGTHAQSNTSFRMLSECRACPAGSSTIASGSSSVCDCRCRAGTYMANATPCEVGGRVDPDSMRCRRCGALLTTSGPGATSRDACKCDTSRIHNLVDLGARACGCAEGSYLDLDAASCKRCPPGRSVARGAALDGVQGCRVTAIFFLFVLCSVLTATGALFALPLALGLLPLQLEDVSLEEGCLVATTALPHGLLRWRKAAVTFKGTGHPALDFNSEKNPVTFLVAVRGDRRLAVLKADGEPETRSRDASQGSIHVSSRQALLSAGFWHVPATGIVLLLAPAFVALELAWQTPLAHLLGEVAVYAGLSLALHMLRLHRSHQTPLATRCRDFGKALGRANPSPRPTSPGAGRGLTIGQLDHLYQFFEHLIGNRDMYFVCSNIVKPLTAPLQLSYAELAGPHQLKWFVSHYWGMGVRHFVEAILKHARASNASHWQTEAYWICTFSNNQWKVREELGFGRWEQSSFYLALRSSACLATLMVVDAEVKPLKRAWCLFEVLQTMELRRGRPNFAGLLLGTSSGVLNFGQSGMDITMELARQVANIDLRTAEASDEGDLQMIRRLVESRTGGFDAVNGFVRQEVCDALDATQQRVHADFQSLMQTLQASLPRSAPPAHLAVTAPFHHPPALCQGDRSPLARPWEESSARRGAVWSAGVAAGKWLRGWRRWLVAGPWLLLVAVVAAFSVDLTIRLA